MVPPTGSGVGTGCGFSLVGNTSTASMAIILDLSSSEHLIGSETGGVGDGTNVSGTSGAISSYFMALSAGVRGPTSF